MKSSKLVNMILVVALVCTGIYIIWDNENQTNRDKLVDSQLKAMGKTIEGYKAEEATLRTDRQKSENKLNDTVKENEALRNDLNNAEKTKLKITRNIVKERKYFKDEVAKLEGKTIEVVKFEKLADCQIDLTFCLEKSEALEFRVLDFMKVATDHLAKIDQLTIERDGKDELLMDERLEYKKAKRRSTIQKGALGIIAFLLLVLK